MSRNSDTSTFFHIHESPEWADRMWDTFGFDYVKGSSPILAWPLDVHGEEVLSEALADEGIEFETFEGDMARVIADAMR